MGGWAIRLLFNRDGFFYELCQLPMQKLFTSLLILSSAACMAQPSTLYFRNLNTGNGLSQNKINCIIQDKRGFTWIGTDDGLNRYDGNRFQVFRHDPSNSATLSGNMITDLLEDKNEILWIATADGGLTRYDYRLTPGSAISAIQAFTI